MESNHIHQTPLSSILMLCISALYLGEICVCACGSVLVLDGCSDVEGVLGALCNLVVLNLFGSQPQ